MPLPPANTPWPPKDQVELRRQWREYDAWYGGDPFEISRAMHHTQHGTHYDMRPSLRIKFWGRPVPFGQRDDRLHVPLPADVAQVSSDLLFAEPPAFTMDDKAKGKTGSGDKATQDRLDEILEEGGVHNRLLEAAEAGAAFGGVYLKADWNKDLVDVPLLSVVHADQGIPEFSFGILTAVTFWREVGRQGSAVQRYLERHTSGLIEHQLYEGTEDNLGRPVPLSDNVATAPIGEGLDPQQGNARLTGIKDLTAAYIPNMLPNRGKMRGKPHGRSDFAQLGPLFDALDETWSSWMRDLRLAKARLIVPRGYLDSPGRGKGTNFDVERELYEALEMPPPSVGGGNGGTGITLVQFAVRVQEHKDTADALVRQVIETAGYSAQTFGLISNGREAALTATEVTAKERRSMTTRSRKARYWIPALRHMTYVLLQLDAEVFGSAITPARPGVEFGDGVSEDPGEIATTLSLLAAAEAVSTETKVRQVHPDWDDTEVLAEVQRIKADTAPPPLLDPTAIGGGSKTPPGPDGQTGQPPPGGPGGTGNPPTK